LKKNFSLEWIPRLNLMALTSTLQRRVIVNNDIVQLINLTLERQSMLSHAGAWEREKKWWATKRRCPPYMTNSPLEIKK
jgi:hypothetical protein